MNQHHDSITPRPDSNTPSSPFDAIRKSRPDGTEFWSARDLMPYLGYQRWENMLVIIDKARAACRNLGQDPASIFLDTTKYSEVQRKPGVDVEMLRYGCYLVAMNGDPTKTEIAAAQGYFALMTRAAELAAEKPKTPVRKSWGDRFKETTMEHFCYVSSRCQGHFSVVSAAVTQMLMMEDILIDHLLPTHPTDLPDGSIGHHWAKYRASLGLPPAALRAPLLIPARGIDVMVLLYPIAEIAEFLEWLMKSYIPVHLPDYYRNKAEFRAHGPLPPASAADHTSRSLAGRPAHLRPGVRKQLTAAGGTCRAGDRTPALERPRQLMLELRA
jgi:hypothetical protein